MQVPVHPALSRLHSLGKSGSPSPHRSRSRSRASSGSGGGARLATPLSTYKIRKASLWDHNETTLFRVKYDGNQSLNAVISWRPPNTVGPRAMPCASVDPPMLSLSSDHSYVTEMQLSSADSVSLPRGTFIQPAGPAVTSTTFRLQLN